MDIRKALAQVVKGQDLSVTQMQAVMRQIMSGGATDAQIGAFLTALRLKQESVDEITAAVMVMRELADGVRVDTEHAVDIVGTGGDGANLFNVSTASCFVVAAAGGQVAKHGNRSVSSKSGSADVLEVSGVRLDLTAAEVERCVIETGVGFMFAPMHHSAMRHAIGPRKELGLRTLFNILGPMTNPAAVKRQLIGVYDAALCRPVAEVLQRLGSQHVLVVHSEDGLDEISLAAPTQVVELRDNGISEYQLTPHDFGLRHADHLGLEVSDAKASLVLIQSALSGQQDTKSRKAGELIALNAGAALYVAGLESSLQGGVQRAQTLMADGSPWRRWQQLIRFTQGL